MLVLVVEDDPTLRYVIAEVLRTEGFSVMAAEDGLQALEILDRGLAPNVIVLDLVLPFMDGRELYGRMQARGITAPVLVLSAHGALAAMVELGAAAALEKPFDLDILVTKVWTLGVSASERDTAPRE